MTNDVLFVRVFGNKMLLRNILFSHLWLSLFSFKRFHLFLKYSTTVEGKTIAT